MTKAPIIEHDTWLYSTEAATGRLFEAGVEHPGDGWKDAPTPAPAPGGSDKAEK
jgi:hypothetical protein